MGGTYGEGEISPMCESKGHRPLRGRCPKKGKILCVTRYETSKKINFEKEESHFNLDKKDVAMTRTSYATAFFYQNAFS